MNSWLALVKNWAKTLKRDVVAVWIAARDPRTPWYAKAAAGAVAAYALSPFDLIPDFIPVLGYLDDLLIVPLGVALVIRLVPEYLMEECRSEAARRTGRPRSAIGAVIVIVVWIVAVVAAAAWFHGHLR